MPLTDPLTNLNVLIVDDDEDFLDILTKLLESIGITRVTRARNGLHALEAIRSILKTIDCIICDYRMDHGNGLEFLQHLRTGGVRGLRADTCFILLTGTADLGVIKTAAELDVNAFIVKPVTPEKLQETIKKARGRYFRVDAGKYAAVILPIFA